jgi:RNA polymerase sigma-70 factor (ECF subfamily)
MDTTTRLWNNYHETLRAFIARRVESRDAADDILQDVFLRTYRQLPSLRDETKLQSWLYQIARNAIVDHYRSRRTTDGALDEVALETDDERNTAEQELASCLRPMIESLPATYRDALVQSDLDGVTQREIAERGGISLSGAKSRVQRARAMLKEQLEACCRFEFDRRGRLVDYTPHACGDGDDCADAC